ncbi:MAG: hypothetical protein HKN72_16370 [Gemmatimonadetes bacterium]|nr:hypothetical protein [Gemmatimonadota bacterium]
MRSVRPLAASSNVVTARLAAALFVGGVVRGAEQTLLRRKAIRPEESARGFSRLAGATEHGTRVPLDVKRRLSGGER